MEGDISPVGEQENDSKGAADAVDSWVTSMMKKLDPNHCKHSPFVICKVHRDLRKDDHGAYTPKIVSIGPFHRRKENVQAMQVLKRRCVNNILPSDACNKKRRLKECLEKMKEMEQFVRSCYSVKIKMSTEEFVEMMVVDGCFLIQLLFQEPNEIKKEDPIYNNFWRLPLIRHDILLLENQLPFVVLEELCPLLGKEKDILWKRALNFYECLLPKEDNVPMEDTIGKRTLNFCKHLLSKEDNVPKEDNVGGKKPEKIYHVLHLIHMYFKPPPSGQQSPPEEPQIKGAAQSIVCGSAWISALTKGRRSPAPPGEQSSQEIEYTPSRQQSSREVPPIYASTLKGSAPTHFITTDYMPQTPPGEQSAQELQHTQSGQQSFEDLSVKMRMAPESFICTSSQAYPVTTHLRPPISPGEQSSQHPAEEDDPFTEERFFLCAAADPRTFTASYTEITVLPRPISPGAYSPQYPAEQAIPLRQQYTLEVTCAPSAGASGNTQSKQYPRQPRPKTIPSATELQEAGLPFQLKKTTNNFLDVTFEEGKLEMPRLCIDDSTNSLFRNFIAFEQSFPYCGSHFTSYCFFMDSLVNTPKDVGILSRKNVIENLLGSDKDAAILFNKLCRGVFINFEDSYLARVSDNIHNYAEEPWHTHRAKLMRDYFSNPWSTLSLVAACLIILLTLVQTFFTIYAYFRPPKS